MHSPDTHHMSKSVWDGQVSPTLACLLRASSTLALCLVSQLPQRQPPHRLTAPRRAAPHCACVISVSSPSSVTEFVTYQFCAGKCNLAFVKISSLG